jgi:hypothetical protein
MADRNAKALVWTLGVSVVVAVLGAGVYHLCKKDPSINESQGGAMNTAKKRTPKWVISQRKSIQGDLNSCLVGVLLGGFFLVVVLGDRDAEDVATIATLAIAVLAMVDLCLQGVLLRWLLSFAAGFGIVIALGVQTWNEAVWITIALLLVIAFVATSVLLATGLIVKADEAGAGRSGATPTPGHPTETTSRDGLARDTPTAPRPGD